jgi:hypothetical protein
MAPPNDRDFNLLRIETSPPYQVRPVPLPPHHANIVSSPPIGIGTGTLPRNWRSFTEIWRKGNAGTVRAAGPGQPAFVYRDMAEIERQNADGARRAGDPSGIAGCERTAMSAA